MPLSKEGGYIPNEYKPYEFEACYYLHYHIFCALHSIEMITNKNDNIFNIFENESQYYHFYCDHLLFSIGQINNRLVLNSKQEKTKQQMDAAEPKPFNDMTSAEKKVKLIILNRNNYCFNDKDYPYLNNKSFRNTIEHIDEHNQKIVARYGGVGGFNVLSASSPDELKKALTERQKEHPYTLYIESGELHIERNFNKRKHLTLVLADLKSELIKLSHSVDSFHSLIQDPFM